MLSIPILHLQQRKKKCFIYKWNKFLIIAAISILYKYHLRYCYKVLDRIFTGRPLADFSTNSLVSFGLCVGLTGDSSKLRTTLTTADFINNIAIVLPKEIASLGNAKYCNV